MYQSLMHYNLLRQLKLVSNNFFFQKKALPKVLKILKLNTKILILQNRFLLCPGDIQTFYRRS